MKPMPAGSNPAERLNSPPPRSNRSRRKRAGQLPRCEKIAVNLIGECHPLALPIAEVEARFAPTFRTLPNFIQIDLSTLSLALPVLLLKPKGAKPYIVFGGFRTLALARSMSNSGESANPQQVHALIFERLTDEDVRCFAQSSVCAAVIAAQVDRTLEGNASLFRLLEDILNASRAAGQPSSNAIRSFARSTGQNPSRLTGLIGLQGRSL